MRLMRTLRKATRGLTALRSNYGLTSAAWMKCLSLAHVSAIVSLQTVEDKGRDDGQTAQEEKCLVDSMNHLRGIGVRHGHKECRCEPRQRDAKADRHLLPRGRDRTGATGLLIRDVGIDQRIHAGVLQRREAAVHKCQQDDYPERRVQPDRGKHQNKDPQDNRVRYQNTAVA